MGTKWGWFWAKLGGGFGQVLGRLQDLFVAKVWV